MDIWDYFDQKEREFGRYPDPAPEFSAAPDGLGGRVRANLGLTADLYVKVYEWVVIEGGRPHRKVYSYALIADEAFVYGWERDPFTHPECPVHEHGPGPKRDRKPAEPVRLSQVLERAWREVSLRAEAPLE